MSEDAVRAQLERVLGSDDFAQSKRMKAFLRFVVEEALVGRGERLKEFVIATEVFGRDESFDPQSDTIVRVEAGRLRRRIERYYLTAGRQDPLRIDLPKGSYAPLFLATAPAPEAESGAAPQAADAALEMPAGPSIAVLPFENLSDDPGQAFFADGITEEIVNALTRFTDLRVISRHSTFKYKGRHVDTREVGRDLGAHYVLEGSVRKAGDTIRVTGKLVDATNGTQLFSETHDRDLSTEGILVIQDDITERIVGAIGQPYGVMARAGFRRARGKPIHSLAAYDAVLHFYEYWLNTAVELHGPVREALERAIELEPDYASAWAGLAFIYLDEARLGFLDPRGEAERLDRALDAAQRAVTLDPESSMAYHALFGAHFHRGELDEFRAAGERGLTLNPNHADLAADFGMMLALSGDWERGLALTEKAVALTPVHPGWFHAAAVFDHYRQGRYDKALARAKQLQLPQLYLCQMMLAMCHGQLGQEREGRAACDKLLELAPGFAASFWRTLEGWNVSDEIAAQIAEGLRKAGLRVSDTPT